MPPKPDRFVADIDPALVQKVFHIAERKRKSDIQHHRKADDVGRCLDVAKWVRFFHPWTLRDRPARLNRFCSDRAIQGLSWPTSSRVTYVAPQIANRKTRGPMAGTLKVCTPSSSESKERR